MFTGLIEQVGRLERRDARATGARLQIAHGPWPEPLEEGESVAVQGACLTVNRRGVDGFEADVLRETLERTNLGALEPGSLLNLERALRLGDRAGGHLVAGHVDAVAPVLRRGRTGEDWVLRVGLADRVADEVVLKGSIALDGVSLTVSALGEGWLEVNIVPYTWAHTSLQYCRAGSGVNVETDMIGKYVKRVLGRAGPADPLTLDTLRRAGFLG